MSKLKHTKDTSPQLVWAFDRASEARPTTKVTYRVTQWLGVWTPILHDSGITRPLGDPCAKKQEAKDICNEHFQACR